MFGWLDIVLFIIFVASMASGFWKGFARIGIGAAATFFGILFAIAFHGTVGAYFAEYVASRGIASFLGFIIILVGMSLLGSLLGRFVAYAFQQAGLGWLDRTLGAGAGFLRALLVAIAIVMALVAFTPDPPARSVVHSRIAPYVLDAARVLVSIAPREMSDSFLKSYDSIKDRWNQALHEGSRVLGSRVKPEAQ